MKHTSQDAQLIGKVSNEIRKEDWAVVVSPDGTLKGVLLPENELDLSKVPVEIRMMIKLVYDDDILGTDNRTIH